MSGLQNTRTGDTYFGQSRPEVLSLLPSTGLDRVLDIGCGAGGTSLWLRDHGTKVVHGIEIVEEQAARADEVLDKVWHGSVEQHLGDVEGPYDAALCLDVLEHLADPYAVLQQVREQVRPGASLLVSLPNARYIGFIADLLFRGTVGYTDLGHRDWTHLRWFTRKDAVKAIEDAGFSVDIVTAPPSHSRLRGLIRRIPIVGELTNIQWYYRATAR